MRSCRSGRPGMRRAVVSDGQPHYFLAIAQEVSSPAVREIAALQKMVIMDSQNNNPAPNITIHVLNFNNDAVITYPVVLLKGSVYHNDNDTPINDEIAVTVSQNGVKKSSTWSIRQNYFKCILELSRGRNKIMLIYQENFKEIILEYTPRKTNLRVTPVYIVCQGHDGCFQSPPNVDNSIESACERIALASKLIQSLMAEKLDELGYGKKTFQLEYEVNQNQSECVVFRSNLNVNKARKMKESELWCHFGRELMLSDLGSNERKFLAFISCTRFKGMDNVERVLSHEEIVSLTEGHAALGGGGLAIFGSACLYTWPRSIEEVVPTFLNNSIIDTKRYMDDSCYRGTIGGCFATTLGSVCHELGHTFDLGHTKDGIMGRGFDHVDRVFTVVNKRVGSKDSLNNLCGKPTQHTTVTFTRNISVTMNVAEPIRTLGPRSKTTLGGFNTNETRRSLNVTPVTRPTNNNLAFNKMLESKRGLNKQIDDGTFWTKNCGVFLNYHRWFNNEYGREREAITRYLKFDKNKMMILSTAGIRIVEVRDERTGMVLDSYIFAEKNPEKRFLVPFSLSAKNKVLEIVVEDDLGNVLKQLFTY